MASSIALLNGRVYTQEVGQPLARAVGVLGNRIAAVGSDDEVLAALPSGADRVDLHGRAVLPGFVDAHFHLLQYCLSRERLQLDGIASLDAVWELVARAATTAPAGAWVLGRGWDRSLWGGQFPTRHDLDGVSEGHPICLFSRDVHAVWVNTIGLELAGIRRDTPDPPGGRILREPDGTPSGILLEAAGQPVGDLADRPSLEATVARLRQCQDDLARVGLTALHNLEGALAFRALETLEAAGELRLRVFAGLWREALEPSATVGLRTGFGGDRLRIGLLKLFADGSLGSGTAALLAPYEGRPDDRGITTADRDELVGLMRRAREAGIGVAIHAIGDAAVRTVLDAAEVVRADPGGRDQLLRIEHAQLVDPDDVPRFGRLGVIASMQPSHAPSDMAIAERGWGARCKTAYPWRSLLDGGAHLAFGSDCPVEPPDPLSGIHAAVTRQRDGEPPGGWYPEQRLGVAEAIAAYTLGSARAAGLGHEHGSIAPNKLADLVVLSGDPYAVPRAALAEIAVVTTVFDGRVVYTA
jgi:predicted amidohydrolase YtcJ